MATWPTSVATDAILYIAVNSLQTTLSGSINNSVTTITLASSTGFPTTGAVTIDSEVIFYTGVSGANLTGCTRGADGTTAASHSSGVPVGATVVAAHHNLLKDEIIAIETSLNLTASRAVATNSSGRLVASSVTDTELGYLSGVTSAIQTQINGKVSSASPTFTGQSAFADGSLAAPGITFSADLNTGLQRPSADTLNLVCGGASSLQLTVDAVYPLFHVRAGDGTVSLPFYTFDNDPDCGLYRTGANAIALGTNGTRALAISSSQAVSIRGSSTNDSPTAGDVGEVISATQTSSTNFPTSNQYGDLTSISLTAGDWLVCAWSLANASGVTMTAWQSGISTTSGNSGTGLTEGDTMMEMDVTFGGTQQVMTVPLIRFSLSGTTTVYLKYLATYSAGTPKSKGRIIAHRIR